MDARTDVFSFGVLLYEMLTGRHPFRRGSQLETLSAIREAEPERPSQVAPGLPPEAERAILRCLHKDPSRRWQSMSDLTAVLQDLREDSESGRARGTVTPETAKRSRAWWWTACRHRPRGGLAAFALYVRRSPRAGPGPLELARLTYDAGYTSDPTISADGKLVAYASDRSGEGHLDIWVQHTTERDAARLTRDPADDWQPTLSPDGSRVVFRSERDGGGLYVVPTLGGQERKIADGGRLPRFSPDGSQIAFLRDVGWTPRGLLPMFLVPAEGGTPRPFQPDFGVPDLPGSVGPIWSPDGRHILFRGFRLKPPGEGDWWVAPVDGGPAVATGAAGAWPRRDMMQLPCAWVGQHVLMAAGTTMEGVNLYRVRIGTDFRVSGPPEPLTSGTGISHLASVSQDGRLVVPRWSALVQLWSFDPEAPAGSTVPQAITRDGAPKYALSLDRRGDRIAYTAMAGPLGRHRMEIRVRELASGEETVPLRLVPTSISVRPRLSPDGALLAWEEFADGKFASFVGKTGEPSGQELCRDCRLLGFALRRPSRPPPHGPAAGRPARRLERERDSGVRAGGGHRARRGPVVGRSLAGDPRRGPGQHHRHPRRSGRGRRGARGPERRDRTLRPDGSRARAGPPTGAASTSWRSATASSASGRRPWTRARRPRAASRSPSSTRTATRGA